MKCKGEVTYHGWANSPAYGTNKTVQLTLSNESSSTTFHHLSKADLTDLIDELEQLIDELENAPMKNAWG